MVGGKAGLGPPVSRDADVIGRVERVGRFTAQGWVAWQTGQPLRFRVDLDDARHEPMICWRERPDLDGADEQPITWDFTIAFSPEVAFKLGDPGARQRLSLWVDDKKLEQDASGILGSWTSLRRHTSRLRSAIPLFRRDPVQRQACDNLALWSELRRLNEQLPAWAGREELLLTETAGRLTGKQRTGLVFSVVPYFCRIGKFDAIRSLIPAAQVEVYARADKRWPLSLVLPFFASRDTADQAGALLSRLAQCPAGWLNSECVAYASHQVLQPATATADPASLERYVYGLIELLDSLRDGYRSRLPDSHVIDAFVACFGEGLPWSETVRRDLAAAAHRLYGLSPEFWSKLGLATRREDEPWPELRRGHAQFRRILDGFSSRERVAERSTEIGEALHYFRRCDNVDAAVALRELTGHLLPTFNRRAGERQVTRAARSLLTLGRAEAVRIAAFPVAAGQNRIAGQLRGLRQRLAAMDDVKVRSGRVAVQARGDAALLELHRALSAEAPDKLDGAVQALGHIARRLDDGDGQYLGCELTASACLALHRAGRPAGALLEPLRIAYSAYGSALSNGTIANWPPAPVVVGLSKLKAALAIQPEPAIEAVIAECEQRLKQHYDSRFHLVSRCIDAAVPKRSQTGDSDVVIVVDSCRERVEPCLEAIRQSWADDLRARGIPLLVALGDGEGTLTGDILELRAPDDPGGRSRKHLELFEWIVTETHAQYVVVVPDDIYLSVEEYFGSLSYRKFHYYGWPSESWETSASAGISGAAGGGVGRSDGASDCLEAFAYADGDSGFCLSRLALHCLIETSRSPTGERLLAASAEPDRLIGDLLVRSGFMPSGEDYHRLVRRRTFETAIPVNCDANTFFSARVTPTKAAHLDCHRHMALAHRHAGQNELWPKRIWPTYRLPSIKRNHNQLELVTPVDKALRLLEEDLIVICVVRNEQMMLRHFLEHYRRLGVKCFVFVDNLSTDGTREALFRADDVVLYSAETEYRKSHYGVAWQQAVMANHGIGKWVLLADADELVIYRDCEFRPLAQLVGEVEDQGYDAVQVLMVDMYPAGDLAEADFFHAQPFAAAACFDRHPVLEWRLGSGEFSNSPSYVSALRHRLIPTANPNAFMAQKCALFRYAPGVRLSEGIHYAANLNFSPAKIWFAHFKYHAGFKKRVEEETWRAQHFNGAEEYQRYHALLQGGSGRFWEAGVSCTYHDSHSFEMS